MSYLVEEYSEEKPIISETHWSSSAQSELAIVFNLSTFYGISYYFFHTFDVGIFGSIFGWSFIRLIICQNIWHLIIMEQAQLKTFYCESSWYSRYLFFGIYGKSTLFEKLLEHGKCYCQNICLKHWNVYLCTITKFPYVLTKHNFYVPFLELIHDINMEHLHVYLVWIRLQHVAAWLPWINQC